MFTKRFKFWFLNEVQLTEEVCSMFWLNFKIYQLRIIDEKYFTTVDAELRYFTRTSRHYGCGISNANRPKALFLEACSSSDCAYKTVNTLPGENMLSYS